MEGPKLMERATEVFGKTREFAQDRAAHLKAMARHRAAHLKAFAREKPLMVALLGVGAGVLLGMFLAPRTAKVQIAIRTTGKPG